MNTQNFNTTFLVDQTSNEVFNAIKNIRGWWSEGIEGSTDKLTDEFIHRYKDIHYCKMQLTELVPDQRVVWLVLENYFKFTKDENEWTGTKFVFDISKKDNQTAISFTHEGLVPQYECYKICSEAWINYIHNSLRNLIITGKGEPNPKEEDGYNTKLVEKWELEQ